MHMQITYTACDCHNMYTIRINNYWEQFFFRAPTCSCEEGSLQCHKIKGGHIYSLMGLDADYAEGFILVIVCMYHCTIMQDKKTMGFFEVAIRVVPGNPGMQ